MKLEQQLAPAREAVTRTLTAGSTNFFKAVEGVRGRWAAQRPDSSSTEASKVNSRSSTPVEVSKADLDTLESTPAPPAHASGIRPFTLGKHASVDSPTPPATAPPVASPARETLSAWGAGIGSFLSTRAPRFSLVRQKSEDATTAPPVTPPKPTQEPAPIPAPITVVKSSESFEPLTPHTTKTPAINVTSPGGTGRFPRTPPATDNTAKSVGSTVESHPKMDDVELKGAQVSDDFRLKDGFHAKNDVHLEDTPPSKATSNVASPSQPKDEIHSKPDLPTTNGGNHINDGLDDEEDAYAGMAI